MRASHTLIAMALASTPITPAVAKGTSFAAPANEPALSANLFCESNLLPRPANVFLDHGELSPLALFSSNDPLALGGTALGYLLLFDECHAAPGEVNLVMFGGGGDQVGLTRRESRASGNAIHIAMQGMTFGSPAPAPAGSGSPGGSSGGGGSAGGASGGGASSGNGTANSGGSGSAGGGNTGGSSNAGNPPAAPAPPNGGGPASGNGNTSGADTLVEWNILPPGSDTGPDSSSTPMHDGGANSAPMPLPAPVWMALAGLTLVVAFRRRLMP